MPLTIEAGAMTDINPQVWQKMKRVLAIPGPIGQHILFDKHGNPLRYWMPNREERSQFKARPGRRFLKCAIPGCVDSIMPGHNLCFTHLKKANIFRDQST